MKKLFTLFLAAFTLAFAARAAVSYWAAAETAAATGDTTGGSASGAYSGYYCTVETAEALFGASSINAVTAYLVANYWSGRGAIESEIGSSVGAGSSGVMTSTGYSHGQYTFASIYGDALAENDYLALIFFDNGLEQYIRVMANDPDDITFGNAMFSDNELVSSGAVGAWAKRAGMIPEPTASTLLLFGLAALALRRRRA